MRRISLSFTIVAPPSIWIMGLHSRSQQRLQSFRILSEDMTCPTLNKVKPSSKIPTQSVLKEMETCNMD
jgi:hypothetical protein